MARRVDRIRNAMWFVATPVLMVVVLAMAVAGFPAAWRAHTGHGTTGVFTAVTEDCGKSCTWSGTFTAPGDDRANVIYTERNAPFEPGTRVAALDVGEPGTVYPRDGGSDWLLIPVLVLVVLAVLALWLVTVVQAWRRRHPQAPAVP
jgi:hypothetical protein